MKGDKAYPLIAEVEAKSNKRLLVRFRNGVTKLYDCKRILALPAFEMMMPCFGAPTPTRMATA